MLLSPYCIDFGLRTDQSGTSEAQNRAHFLSTNLISFYRSRGIALVMPVPARKMDGPGSQRKICEVLGISALKGYQVEALEAICLNKRDTLVCVFRLGGGRKSSCFEGVRTVTDHVTGKKRAASLVRHL